MYRDRPVLTDTLDLDQGDLLVDVLRLLAVTGKNFSAVVDGNKLKKSDSPETAEALKGVSERLRVISRVERQQLCIVLSNSCDNCSENLPVLLAPVREFRFETETPKPADQWMEISTAATGTANPRFFYLTDSPAHGLVRGEVQLNLMFPVSHDYLRKCVSEVGARRPCGLTIEAQVHLQHALALFFGRHAREDYDWPSISDIELKIAWLQAQIDKGGRFQARNRADLARAETELQRRKKS